MRGYLEKGCSFLIAAQNEDGGWGYSARSGQSAPEPSCHSLLALRDFSADSAAKGLSWLESRIGPDGGLRYEGDEDIHWSTSLAAYCLVRLRHKEAKDAGKLRACLACLSALRGSSDKGVGWAWTNQTFSWVEPTSYGLLALKAAGQANNPRVREAEVMLQSRTCADGGWNQGLLRAFYEQAEPLATQTALGILALQDVPAARTPILKAVAYLRSAAGTHPTVLSLVWSTLAMNAIGEDPGSLPAELEKRQEPEGSWRSSVLLTALAVLALQAVTGGRNAFKL